ncbi:MAG: cyclic nucleotide-binding domain-containing protein [Archangium sp.]
MITKRDASIATFLRSVPVFHDLKGPSLDILFEFLEERKWDVGEHICNEGELGRTLYVIREGEVEVLRRSSKGNNQSIVKLGPGECFGEMTLVELQPRSATCVVRKKAVTYSLTNLDLWNLYKSDNFAYVIILQNICRMLSRRLRKADSRIVEFLELLDSVAPKKAGAKPGKKKKK